MGAGSRRAVLLSLAAAASLLATSCGAQTAEVVLDPKTVLQTMRGWEVTGEIADVEDNSDKALPYYQDDLIALAVDRVGINRLRLEVRSGAENTDRNWERYSARQVTYKQWRPLRYATVNDNDDPHVLNKAGFDFAELDNGVEQMVIPLQKRLAARGERLFVNLCYVAFTSQLAGGAYHHNDPEEYAEFVLATYLHLKEKYGLTPDTFEVILEPDLVGWSGTQIGERMVAAAKRLRAEGFKPAFVVPSVTDMGNAPRMIDEILAVPGAAETIAEISYHRYQGGTKENLKAIVDRAERHNLPTAMTEWWFENATHKVLYEDLTLGRNAAWQINVLMDLAERNLANPTKPVLKLRETSRYTSQYFRYARMGAHRIGATSNAGRRVEPVAFINPNGAYAVVMKAEKASEIVVKGLPAGEYRVSYAVPSGSVELPAATRVAAGGVLSTAIPDEGVISVFDARLSRPAP